MRTDKHEPANDATEAIPLARKAIAEGTLFDGRVDCYVLGDGRRVIPQRAILRALRNTAKGSGAEYGALGRFLGRLPKRFAHLAAEPDIEFEMPARGRALGREASFFADLCAAYIFAFAAGELRSSQVHLAQNAIALQSAFAKVGIDAMVEEACGIAHSPAEKALEKRFNAYLRLEAMGWEPTFPVSLVEAMCPLYGIQYASGTSYPKALHGPFGLIYDYILTRDVSGEMRRRNTDPEKLNHHQLLTDPARRMLATELAKVEVVASQASNRDEFWARIRNIYLGEPMQGLLWNARGPRRAAA